MNRLKNLIAVFAFSLLVFALPTIASAQWRDRDRDNDDYNRNGRYNRNLESTIKNLKNRSKEFSRRLDRELDRSRYDSRNREDRLNDLADDFRRATERLDKEYDGRGDYRDSQDEARRVIQLGSQLDTALYRSRLNSNLQGDWNRIQQDLDVLANAYGYNNNNRNNRNNRNTNGDWRNRVPFPLPW
ncbi:MAG TPA: hypothetical protein VGC97_23550 [Pyrinomonadaceae bacterium]|jgi:hypothetical protein